jgi:hypothetical protein
MSDGWYDHSRDCKSSLCQLIWWFARAVKWLFGH